MTRGGADAWAAVVCALGVVCAGCSSDAAAATEASGAPTAPSPSATPPATDAAPSSTSEPPRPPLTPPTPPTALPDYNALFVRDAAIGDPGGQHGFRSADGGWSVALPEVANGAPASRTLWSFGDTTVYNEETGSVNDFDFGPTAVRNSIAVLVDTGAQAPTHADLTFYARAAEGAADAGRIVDIDDRSDAASWTGPGGAIDPTEVWRWPGDSVYVPGDGRLFMFWLQRSTADPNPCFEAHAQGDRHFVTVVSNPESHPTGWDVGTLSYELVDGAGTSPYALDLQWGSSVFFDAEDGWVYVYGVTLHDRSRPCAPLHLSPGFADRLVLARARPNDLVDYTRWQFWRESWTDGTPTGVDDLAVVARLGQSEMSVDRVTIDGTTKYVFVHGRGLSENDVVVRLSDEPTSFDDVEAGFPTVWIFDPQVLDPAIGRAEEYLRAYDGGYAFPDCSLLTTETTCAERWRKCQWSGDACVVDPDFRLWVWAIKGHSNLSTLSGSLDGRNTLVVSYYPEMLMLGDSANDPCAALTEDRCDRIECLPTEGRCESFPAWGRLRFFEIDLAGFHPWCDSDCYNCVASDCADVE